MNNPLLLAITVSMAGTGWAGLTACTGQTIATLTSSADNGNNPPNGCGQSDLGFSNLSAQTQFPQQIDLSATGGINGGTTMSPITSTFTLTGSNSESVANTILTNGFLLGAGPVVGQSLPTHGIWALSGLTVAMNATSSAPPGEQQSIQLTVLYCLGDLSVSCFPNSSQRGYVELYEYFQTNGTTSYYIADCTPSPTGCVLSVPTPASSATISLPFASELGVAATVEIEYPSGPATNTLTLNSISLTWDQTEVPEPSAFLLVGAGFLALLYRPTISIFVFLSVLAHAQTGAGKQYETRDPFTCKSKKDPSKGAPAGNQLKDYVLCSNERIGGGFISLLQNLQVEIGKSRPYSAWSDSGNTSIDNSQPVYPIRGSYDLYSCRPPGSMGFPAGKNCNVRKNSEFAGICFKTTFNDWSCPVQGVGDGLSGITYSVPGPK